MKVPKVIATSTGSTRWISAYFIDMNNEFVAISSSFIVYFYTKKALTMIDSFSRINKEIVFVRLNPVKSNEVAIGFIGGSILYLNFLTQIILMKFENTPEFSCVEFSPDGSVLVMSESGSGVLWKFFIATGEQVKTRLTISSCHIFKFIPGTDTLYYASSNGKIFTADINGKNVKNSDFYSHPIDILFDPLNYCNCLLLTKLSKWVYVDLVPNPHIISSSENIDILFSCGDWIPGLPNHIILGDSRYGIIYIYQVSTTKRIFSQTIGTSPLYYMRSISNNECLCAFMDGSFGIYDYIQKKYTECSSKDHLQTIFAAEFCSDSSTLLSASYDGTFCFWNAPDLKKKGNIELEQTNHNVYSANSSHGGGFLAVGTREGYVDFYSLDNGRLLFSQKLHNSYILSVKWMPYKNKQNIIASAGGDKVCNIFDVDSRLVTVRVTLKNELRRVDWSPYSESIAIACSDGSVYIRNDGGNYFVVKSKDSPLFDVKWSPHDENVIGSCNDDGDIIIFDVSSGTFQSVPGHKGAARAVAFIPNNKDHMLSGGYDGKLILWNIKTLTKVCQIDACVSHIYNIEFSKACPNLFLTSSRDATIKLWTIDNIFPEEHTEKMLKGEKYVCERYISKPGFVQLTKLLHRILKDSTKISFGENDLLHVRDLLRISKKRHKKAVSSLPTDHTHIQKSKKYKMLAEEAAQAALRNGQPNRFCELMFLSGNYDEALIVAPMISYGFWQGLIDARIQMLGNTQEAAELSLIAGRVDDAVDILLKNECYEVALLVTVSAKERHFQPKTISIRSNEEFELPEFINKDMNLVDYKLYKVASERSRLYASQGHSLLAAASLLTVGDIVGCIHRLINSGEIEWAMDVSITTKTPILSLMSKYFMYCCYHNIERMAFKYLPPKLKRLHAASIVFESDEERSAFYKENGLKTPKEYANEIKSLKGMSSVQFRFLAGKIDDALSVCVHYAEQLIGSGDMNFIAMQEVVQYLHICAPHIKPNDETGNACIALCHYCGLYEAFWKGFNDIIPKLLSCFIHHSSESKSAAICSLSDELRIITSISVAIIHKPIDGQRFLSDTFLNSPIMQYLNRDLPKQTGGCFIGLSSSIIASSENSLVFSAITENRIKHNPFILEDNKTMIADEESIRWFRVTPFSPLKTAAFHAPR